MFSPPTDYCDLDKSSFSGGLDISQIRSSSEKARRMGNFSEKIL